MTKIHKSPINILLDKIAWTKNEKPKQINADIPYATHEGVLQIGDIELRCVVLNTGERLILAEDIEKFFEIEDGGQPSSWVLDKLDTLLQEAGVKIEEASDAKEK